jgi:hypothetical protein
LTPFLTPGSTLTAPRCTTGDIRANPRFHRGPHFAACAAKRSSAPGMKKRRGEAVAMAPAPTMTPVERVKARACGIMIADVLSDCVCEDIREIVRLAYRELVWWREGREERIDEC